MLLLLLLLPGTPEAPTIVLSNTALTPRQTDFARRLVSGKKARTVDEELGTDLDLARISDQVIISASVASRLG